jgi:DNA-binding NarL/FixJ family response regulator
LKRILIIEDEIIVAKDISEVLESCGYRICGIANNAKSAMQLFKSRIPDMIICDINLGAGKSGVDLIRETQKIKKVPVIYLTAYSDNNTVDNALDTSPASYITKPFTSEQLCIAVNRVFRSIEPNADSEMDLPKPTKREMEIIQLVADGMSSKKISKKLSISFETVQSHRKNLLNKYNISSSAELIAIAHKNGWLT